MLDSAVTKKADQHMALRDDEWIAVSELCVVLSDLTETTSYMSTEKNVSCSEIYPIVRGLLANTLRIGDFDSDVVRKVKDLIAEELHWRFCPTETETGSSVPVLAALLDPRYKDLDFLSSAQRHKAEEALEGRLDDIPLRLPESEPTPSKRPRLSFMMSKSSKPQNDELRRYLQEPADECASPLDWWQQNQCRFPRIAIVARRLLGIPATSVPSERIFSCAGLIVNKLRNRLTCDLVDKIIFLNKNYVTLNHDDNEA
jgi:hypothetical protein